MLEEINSIFPGVHSILNSADRPRNEDVADDVEGEKETLPDLTAADSQPLDGISQWRESVTGASKGISNKTNGDYQR